MSPADRRPWLLPCLAGVLVLVFLLQCFLASGAKSPAWDETGDIAAGLSYLLTDKFTVNLQHPPLLKELIALSALASGARWPGSPAAQAVLAGDPRFQWKVGDEIIIANGADNVMFWARLPMILVGAMLAVVLYLWGRSMLGGAAAVGAVFLYALDPTIVAHAQLTTLDVGFAAFTVLFSFALWKYLRYPTTKRLTWCGVALGAVLATKFSALMLLPVAALLVLAAVWKPPAVAGKAPRAFINLYGGTVAPSIKAGPNDPCPCGSGKKFKKCHGEPGKAGGDRAHSPARMLTGAVLALAAMGVIAVCVVEALYFFPRDPFLYLKGMSLVNADHARGYQYYLAGHLEQQRFLSYFVVAWLLKEPLATIVLTILGLVLVLRSRRLELLDKLFLLAAPAVLLAAHTLMADDLGFRYVIPVLPFAHLLGGAALAELVMSGVVWKRAVAGVLCAWLIVVAFGIHPDNLSYFNEAACLLDEPGKTGPDGGSRCGTAWLDDSNVDWGAGLKQLREWWNKNAAGRSMKLAYFGSFPPEYYGLRYEPVDERMLATATPPPGLYVVSAHSVARVPHMGQNGAGEWLRRIPPVAIVGHCLYVYDIK
jgi:hypothetical protein